VLGPNHLSYEVERQPGEQVIRLHVEGLAFPDAHFLGLVSLSVSLVDMGVGTALGRGMGLRDLGTRVEAPGGQMAWDPLQGH
jgi:hypothetical protein